MRISSVKALAIAMAAVAASACGVKKTTTDNPMTRQRAATCAEAITTYASRSDVPSDYYELAFIEAEGNSVYTTDNKLRDEIRDGAAKVGASAIIVNSVEQSKTTVKVLGEAVATASATQKTSALAIYLPADRDRIRATCGS